MKLKNKSISEYSMCKLSKIDDSFSVSDLDRINELVINNKTIINDKEEFSFYELYKFNNIEKITFRFFNIYEEDILILNFFKKLKDITFDNCGIKNINMLNELNNLSLINCDFNISDITFMKSLVSLTIINKKIDLDIINNLENIKYLNLSSCKLYGEFKLLNIEILHIDNTDIDNFSFISNLNKLKELTIDKNQYDLSKDFFDDLNIKVNIVDRWD